MKPSHHIDLYLLPPDDNAQVLGALFTLQDRIENLVILSDGNQTEIRRLDRLAKSLQSYAKKRKLKWHIVRRHFSPQASTKAPPIDGDHAALLAAATESTTLLSWLKNAGDIDVYAYDAWEDRLVRFHRDGAKPVKTRSMNLNDFCDMLGYAILDSKEEPENEKTIRARAKLFENETTFSAARKALLDNGAIPPDAEGPVTEALRDLGIVDRYGFLMEGARVRLQGGLFEEYVYTLCQKAGFDDAALGCKIDFTPTLPDPHAHVVNEFDVLLMHRNRVATVECKYVHRLDGLGFLYKYDAVVDYFGQTARALILNVSHRPRHPENRGENFTDAVLRRSLLGNVRILSDTRFDRVKFLNMLEWLKQ